jgi:hypothetical protein
LRKGTVKIAFCFVLWLGFFNEVVVGIFFVNETITGLGGMLMPNIYQRMGSDTPNRRYTVTWDIQEIDTTSYT